MENRQRLGRLLVPGIVGFAAFLSFLVVERPWHDGDDGERAAGVTIVEDLYDVSFVDGERGWVVGQFGSVYHTADGGRTWTADVTPTKEHLFAVGARPDGTRLAVGRSGTVLRAEGAAGAWEQAEGTGDDHFFGVEWVDSTSAWVVGDWGAIWRTVDGGRSWEDRSLDEDRILNDVDFVDGTHGWIVGEFGTILRTGDGGDRWERVPAGTDKTFFGVAARSAEEAWVVGIDGLVLRTRDAGSSWEVLAGDPRPSAVAGMGFETLMENPGLYGIELEDGRGVIVGDSGTFRVSVDGGETWTAQELDGPARFRWLHAAALLGDAVAIVGAEGTVKNLSVAKAS